MNRNRDERRVCAAREKHKLRTLARFIGLDVADARNLHRFSSRSGDKRNSQGQEVRVESDYRYRRSNLETKETAH